MSAIENFYAERLTTFTVTGAAGDSWNDITSAVISNASLTAGKKYLIIATAMCETGTASQPVALQVVHGSTAFASSAYSRTPTSTSIWYTFAWFTVWTAVSSEDVKVQLSRIPGTAATVSAFQVTLFMMNLSDALVENTDWAFNEVLASTALTTTDSSTNNATVTLTPGNAGDDWLVMTCMSLNATHTEPAFSKVIRTGEASTSTPSRGMRDWNVTNGKTVVLNVYPIALGAASNTFTEKSATINSNGSTRTGSAVLMLNLAKFKEHAIGYTAAATDLSATSYATLAQSVSITPSVTGNVYVIGNWKAQAVTTGVTLGARLQSNNGDIPGTATTSRDSINDSGANPPITDAARIAVTATTLYTLDNDASISSALAGRAAAERSLVAFTTELASPPVPNTPIRPPTTVSIVP